MVFEETLADPQYLVVNLDDYMQNIALVLK